MSLDLNDTSAFLVYLYMKNTLLILGLSICFIISAQTKGKIIYKIVLKKDSLEQPYENPENTESKNAALEMMYDSQPVQGFLVFNDNKSIYYVDEEDNIPTWENFDGTVSLTPAGINLTWFIAGGEGLVYNDISRSYHIEQTNSLGKPKRLIKQQKEWILEDETKIIDGYLCKLAVIEKLNNSKLKAWYTTEIPINHGPRDYFGLPGMIVKIEDIIYEWTITNVDFESEEANYIEEPTEGELITLDEYRRLAGNPFGKKE